MNDAGLKLATPKGVANDMVITPGAFNGHENVTQAMLLASPPYLPGHEVEFDSIVSHMGRRHKHFAIKIGEQPLTACLGAIDTNNAKVLRSNLLNPSMNTASGLLNGFVRRTR